MANTNWRFTALEFLVAWQHLGRDRLPFPLTFVGTAESALEFEEQRRQAAIVVRDRMDDNLYRALTALAEPLARVEVCGFNGPQRTSMIRVHAGVDNSIGAVAAQQPGPTFDVGTDIFLSLHSTASVGTRIVGVLPPIDAGRLRGITADKNDIVRRPKTTSVLSDGQQLSPGAEARRFFDRAYNTYGGSSQSGV